MKTVKQYLKIVDYHTGLMLALALLATVLCRRFNLIATMPTDLIGIAVIFPLVFTINSAYRQREDALKAFADLKGFAMGIFYAYRDWSPTDKDLATEGQILLTNLLSAIYLHFTVRDLSHKESMKRVYKIFSDYSLANEKLRQVGVPANEISRVNQYLRGMMVAFENMSHVARYRPPRALRAYSRLFLNLFPILFAPHFASISYPEHPILGYAVAGIYSLVLVSLDNVLDDLENPFDNIGADDLRLNIAERYHSFTELDESS